MDFNVRCSIAQWVLRRTRDASLGWKWRIWQSQPINRWPGGGHDKSGNPHMATARDRHAPCLLYALCLLHALDVFAGACVDADAVAGVDEKGDVDDGTF